MANPKRHYPSTLNQSKLDLLKEVLHTLVPQEAVKLHVFNPSALLSPVQKWSFGLSLMTACNFTATVFKTSIESFNLSICWNSSGKGHGDTFMEGQFSLNSHTFYKSVVLQ